MKKKAPAKKKPKKPKASTSKKPIKTVRKKGGRLSVSPEIRQKIFLDAMIIARSITGATAATGISRGSHAYWLADSEQYRKDYQDVLDSLAETLEQEAIRRAIDGWKEPVYQGGELVGHKRKYSDQLLIFMLKGMRPEKYKERQQEVVGLLPDVTIYIPDNGRGDDSNVVEGKIVAQE